MEDVLRQVDGEQGQKHTASEALLPEQMALDNASNVHQNAEEGEMLVRTVCVECLC